MSPILVGLTTNFYESKLYYYYYILGAYNQKIIHRSYPYSITPGVPIVSGRYPESGFKPEEIQNFRWVLVWIPSNYELRKS